MSQYGMSRIHTIIFVVDIETEESVEMLLCAGEYISDALHKLKTSWNPRRPQESWQPLKQLQSRLQQRAQKRSAYTIHMVDISPALTGLKDSLIAMPGVASRSGTIITVSAVDNNIAILPTKTKPKKLVFHGSDGQL